MKEAAAKLVLKPVVLPTASAMGTGPSDIHTVHILKQPAPQTIQHPIPSGDISLIFLASL